MTATCSHGDRDWRCPTCCLLNLRRDLHRLELAVSVRDKSSAQGGRSIFGSREPINLPALALLQDIHRAGGLDYVERQLNTLRDPAVLADLRTGLRRWRSRAALVLRDALAPYPLTWDTPGLDDTGRPTVVTRPIPCPVIDQIGTCDGPLHVHRENEQTSADYGKPAVIRCPRDDSHEWTLAQGGWLRLGVLLGGVA
jgi:hypothetical protein